VSFLHKPIIEEFRMVLIRVDCPHCGSDQVVKRGKSAEGKQRYLCQNEACSHRAFNLEYSYRGRVPEVKQKVVDMALNGRGIRDTARVLGIRKDTVLSALKKRKYTRGGQRTAAEAIESR
jgi:transposase-like protein